MKTSAILAAVAGAALAAAQLDALPTCSLTCAISAIGTSGCAQTDIACICSASTFLTGIYTCIQGACTPAEIEQTLGAAQVLCASAGVTITLPGSEPTTTSETPSSTAEPEPTTTEEPTTTSTTEEPEPTTEESTSSVVTLTTYTTVCPTTSTTIIPTYTPPAVNTTTVAPPPPAYTGAAGSIVANAGTVLLGAALAMFFA
ncbi:hypothetical protein ABW19_dt0204409 [Dactylella cylindrospora]|nr:hypothetical protein ABW19_dt0204409 [Dactylella cylindrospora]